MKRMMLLALLLVLGISAASARAHLTIGVSFGVFYSSLDPYGDWIAIGHGLYGWRPNHGGHLWRPYRHGRWIWTDDGWYWASDEPWAWAVYHYGRWYYDDYYGWIWIPGSEWAPAWVEWRWGGSCVGWAPLGPYAIFDRVYGIRYTASWEAPGDHWLFVDARYMGRHDVASYVYPVSRNRDYILRTESAGNVRYRNGRVMTGGPDRSSIERRSGRRIERADITGVSDRSRDGIRHEDGREIIRVYRPEQSQRGVESDRWPERPARVRGTERQFDPGTRSADLWRQLRQDPKRAASTQQGEYEPVGRPSSSVSGRPEGSLRREEGGGRPESPNARMAERSNRRETRDEPERERRETRSNRGNRER